MIVKGKNGRPDEVMTSEEFNTQAIKEGSALERAREQMRNRLNNPGFQQILNSFNPSMLSTTSSPHRRQKPRTEPFSKLQDDNEMITESSTLSSLQSSTFSTRPPTTRIPLPPMPTTKSKANLRFHFFNNSITSTTPNPQLRQPPRTTARPNRPRPTNNIRKPPPTIATTISSVVTKTIGNVKDKMKAARNKLRALMGAKPIGSTKKPRGRPNSSSTKIQKEREKLLAMLQQQKEEEIKAAAVAAGHTIDYDYLDNPVIIIKDKPNPIPLDFDSGVEEGRFQEGTEVFNTNFDSPIRTTSVQPDVMTDHKITVMAKSNFGGFNPTNLRTNNNFNAGLNEQSNNGQLNILTTPPTSQQQPINPPKPTSNMGHIIDDQTENAMKINVMDVPSRMQQTLRNLLRKNGLRKKPFQKLAKKPTTVVNTKKEFLDFQRPPEKQKPLQGNLWNDGPLQGNHRGVVQNLETPSTKQDTLLRPLVGSHNEKIQGLQHPSLKQNTFLNQLKPGQTSQFPGLTAPNKKQNTLLRNLKSNDEGFVNNIETPHNKQSTLLRSLRPNDQGHVGNIQTPRVKQDTLLRNLKDNDVGFVENLQTPHNKQNTLLRNLKPNDHGRVANLETPDHKQDTLLRNLSPNDQGHAANLETPALKQDTLLRPLSGNNLGNYDGLETPSRHQNLLLRPLTSNSNEEIPNLETPPRKQDTLLKNLRQKIRKIKEQKTDRTINLLVPQRIQRPQSSHFNPNILSTPNKRQNPLLKILRFDERERVLRKGLSPPNFKQYPLFHQVVRTPQKYHKDFLRLPERDQSKLIEILNRHGGDQFDANSILLPPPETSNLEVKHKDVNRFKPKAVFRGESVRHKQNVRNRVVRPSKNKETSHRVTQIHQTKNEPENENEDQEDSLEKGEKHS